MVYMKTKSNKMKMPGRKEESEEEIDPQGYPVYPASEDIYTKFQKGKDIDPEDISKNKESNKNVKTKTADEIDFYDDESGSDLDIPGSELDDEQELVGNEDEENNYYSIGGDDHIDLEEDKDEL